MTDYTRLVEDLRDIEKTMFALGTSPTNMNNVSINLAYDKKWGYTAADAAAAIEALQAQLPKRGEIVRCGECKWWYKPDDSPYGYCNACKHGHYSEHWEICIYRRYEADWFCADGERKVQE